MSKQDPFAALGFKSADSGGDPFASLGFKPEASPTLLASRQAASASDFEKNLPPSTMATRAREAAIGVLAPFNLHSVPDMVKSVGSVIYDALSGNAAKTVENAKNIVTAPFQPVKQFAAGVQSGDYNKAAEGAGGILSQTVPAVAGAAEMVKPIGKTSLAEDLANRKPVGQAIQDRAITSLVQPDKKAFDFGADPVEAAKTIPPSASFPAMRRRVAANIEASQNEIAGHIADRAAAAAEVGAPTGIDIRPFVESAANQAVADAAKAANPGLVGQIKRTAAARLSAIEKEYGSTYLEPDQIINEKMDLSKDVRFVQPADTVGQNLNTARMKMYQAMDGALNRMFGSDAVSGIESPVKTANQNIASNIELDKLLERRQLASERAPMLGSGGIVQSIKSQMPEALPKTIINRLAGGGKGGTQTSAASAYEFFAPPSEGYLGAPAGPSGTRVPSPVEPIRPVIGTRKPSPVEPVRPTIGTRVPSPVEPVKPVIGTRKPSPYEHPPTKKKLGQK